MLILRRYVGEEIIVWQAGKSFKVRIVVQGINDDGSVKLGFEADESINIDRKEIYNRKRKAAPGICAPGTYTTRGQDND